MIWLRTLAPMPGFVGRPSNWGCWTGCQVGKPTKPSAAPEALAHLSLFSSSSSSSSSPSSSSQSAPDIYGIWVRAPFYLWAVYVKWWPALGLGIHASRLLIYRRFLGSNHRTLGRYSVIMTCFRCITSSNWYIMQSSIRYVYRPTCIYSPYMYVYNTYIPRTCACQFDVNKCHARY